MANATETIRLHRWIGKAELFTLFTEGIVHGKAVRSKTNSIPHGSKVVCCIPEKVFVESLTEIDEHTLGSSVIDYTSAIQYLCGVVDSYALVSIDVPANDIQWGTGIYASILSYGWSDKMIATEGYLSSYTLEQVVGLENEDGELLPLSIAAYDWKDLPPVFN